MKMNGALSPLLVIGIKTLTYISFSFRFSVHNACVWWGIIISKIQASKFTILSSFLHFFKNWIVIYDTHKHHTPYLKNITHDNGFCFFLIYIMRMTISNLSSTPLSVYINKQSLLDLASFSICRRRDSQRLFRNWPIRVRLRLRICIHHKSDFHEFI